MLRERAQRKALHGHGIRTADEHVAGVLDCFGGVTEAALDDFYGEDIRKALAGISTEKLLKDARDTLVYSNEETVCDGLIGSICDITAYCKALKVELPPRTLMVFDAVVTTPRKDRDGDRLRTEGAIVDERMPTLWHHMLPMPVGRLLKVLQHSERRLKVASTLIDSPLGLDTAHLMEHGALRISHGFRPLEFEAIQSKEGEPPGFDVKKFEVLEVSVVTVPSNPDAVITAYSGGKLHHPDIKEWARRQFDERQKVFAAASITTADMPDPAPQSPESKAVLDDAESGGEEAAPPTFEPENGKPYPNEHACRLRDPGDFKPGSFRRTTRKHEGKTYSVIMGRLKGENTMTEQAYRYPKDGWQKAEANRHCKEHKGRFEAASETGHEPCVECGDFIPTETLTKAGRVLSKANENRLRKASELLTEVLNQLGKEEDGKDKPKTHQGAGRRAITPEQAGAAVRKALDEAISGAKQGQ